MAKVNLSEWDNVANQWDLSMQNGDWFQRNIIYPTILKALIKVKNKRILDVGCGNGHLSRYLSALQAKVTGIDNSQEMINICKKNNSGIEYHTLDITSEKFSNRKFDFIIFNNSIQDMKNYVEGLNNASLMLKRGGLLVICVKHPCFHPNNKNAGWAIETEDGEELFTGQGLTGISQLNCHYNGKYFIMEDYFNSFEHIREWYGQNTTSYSRTIETYCNALINCNLKIAKIEEPKPLDMGEKENPDLYSLLLRIPNFIFFTARK